MSLPKHLLVATDFSDASMPALEAAKSLAESAGAKVTLINVFDPTPMVPPAAIPNPKGMEARIERELHEKIQKDLEELRSERFAGITDVELAVVRHANPALAICNYAEAHDVDQIVVGSHGRTGFSHLLIGSVAERVVRHAPCPVLTVRHRKGE